MTTNRGEIVDIGISGNVTNSQISITSITTYFPNTTTTISFTITGPNGTTGFSNMTIPKEAILQGTKPVVFIDGKEALNQGYTQDSDNFYVWYTTEFSTHQMKIQFTIPQTPQVASLNPLFAIVIIVPEIILIYTVIAVKRLRRKPEAA